MTTEEIDVSEEEKKKEVEEARQRRRDQKANNHKVYLRGKKEEREKLQNKKKTADKRKRVIYPIFSTVILSVFALLCYRFEQSFLEIFGWLVVIGLSFLFLFVLLPLLKRAFADYPLFWIRMPVNHGAILLKDKKVHKIYLSVIDEDMKYFMDFTEDKSKYKFIESGEEIQWFGVFWSGYSINEYNAKSKDETNKIEDPQIFINLQRQTWDWGKGIVPKVDTADPTQVQGRLIVIVRIVDVEKYVFKAHYAQEEMQKRLFSAWRKIMSSLTYLNKEDGEGGNGPDKQNSNKKKGKGSNDSKNDALQRLASKALNFELGYTVENSEELVDEEDFRPNTFAVAMIDLGFHVYEIKVEDIDPDDEIRDNLNSKLIAQTRKQAMIEEAKGRSEANFLERKGLADGQKYRADSAGVDGSVIIEAEKVIEVSKGVNDLTIVSPNGELGGLFNAGLVGGKGFNKSKEEKPKEEKLNDKPE